MQLVERDDFLATLETKFNAALKGEGHTVFICGEAGIGKTSLVKTFSKSVDKQCVMLEGTCDALFTPSPLAPVYDIFLQLRNDEVGLSASAKDRMILFNTVFLELKKLPQATIIIFEDIHWADEATIDFIKFLARRIHQLRCLFLLTYRDNEIHSRHPLRNVLGQLPHGSFTKMELPPLSKQAVEMMATKKGYKGEDIYKVSGGNPYYVCEMMESYHDGVPENIRDSILASYHSSNEKTKEVWQILSVLPAAFELNYLEVMAPHFADEITFCLEYKVLVIEGNHISFKHELFRRTIESSLSPLDKIKLHKRILQLFLKAFEEKQELERIVHHAKNANEAELVIQYAPVAAKRAALLGAHVEASKLYRTALDYYKGDDKMKLVELYDDYIYECYLTNQIKEAISFQEKVYSIWHEENNAERTGNSLRFLSRLWWFAGNRKNANHYGARAIEVLKDEPDSRTKAMAFSNMSQLKMLSDEAKDAVYWGEQAITIAKALGDDEILCHALNNVGTVMTLSATTQQHGYELLEQSLHIALENGYDEHAARAYTNMGSAGVKERLYTYAAKALNDGINYCEERDLNSWTTYMLSWKARLLLEAGNWKEADEIATNLLSTETYPPVRLTALVVSALIKMRRGEGDCLSLLEEAKKIAVTSMEIQRIAPVFTALLEYEWITGDKQLTQEEINEAVLMILKTDSHLENSNFIFWLWKARGEVVEGFDWYEGYLALVNNDIKKAIAIFHENGCKCEEALALLSGDEEDKKTGLALLQELGANAVFEKMKQQLRNEGVKSIPRGKRKTTQSNPGQLTEREIDIVKLLHQGMQNKEIAEKLFISPKTVDHHISSILYKLEVNSRTKAAKEAIRLGIIKDVE